MLQKQRLFLYLMTSISIGTICAQPKVTNVDANPVGKTIAVTYDLNERSNISVYVASSSHSYRKIDSRFLKGDVGKNIKAGVKKEIVWYVLDENPDKDFNDRISFKVNAVPAFKPFLLAQGAYAFNPNQWSIGLMAGAVGVAGFYIKGATNCSAMKKCNYVCGEDGLVNYQDKHLLPDYSGKKSSVDYMASAGAVVRMYIPLYLYAGVGYGCRELYWKTNDGQWINHLGGNYKGICGDLGLMGNINHFAVSVGVSTIQFKYVEVNVGIGYIF